ncbi:MAG TPA: DoxX family protein [Fimbriimonadaceae bacterium]
MRGLSERTAVVLLRCALGVIFLWFGILKLFPGRSPAEALAGKTILMLTFGLMKPALSVPFLGLFETVLGLLLVSGKAVRLTTAVMLFHMAGTLTPLVLFPHDTFAVFPFEPNLVGQYILKNFVLIAGALVVASMNPKTFGTSDRHDEVVPLAA